MKRRRNQIFLFIIIIIFCFTRTIFAMGYMRQILHVIFLLCPFTIFYFHTFCLCDVPLFILISYISGSMKIPLNKKEVKQHHAFHIVNLQGWRQKIYQKLLNDNENSIHFFVRSRSLKYLSFIRAEVLTLIRARETHPHPTPPKVKSLNGFSKPIYSGCLPPVNPHHIS